MARADDLLAELAALAGDVAPAFELTDGRPLLQAICATARLVTGAAACSIAVVSADAESLSYVAADGEGAAAMIGVDLPIDRGFAGYVASSGQALVVDSVRADPRFAADIAERSGYVPDTLVVAPVLGADGEVVGVLSILDRAAVGLSSNSVLDIAAAFADQAGHALALVTGARDLGSALLAALSDAAETGDSDLAAAIARRVDGAPNRNAPQAQVAQVAAKIAELRRLGPAISASAERILDELIAYGRSSRGRRR